MRLWKLITVLCFAVALTVLPLMTACGGDDDEKTPTAGPTEAGQPTTEPPEEVTIKIGNLTDKTGPASTAMQVMDMALKDLARYYNEQNLIPNVKLEIIEYDTQYEPSRDIPGYEWVMEKGADFVFTGLPTTPLTIKSSVNQDEVVLFSMSGLEDLGDPPGWVFVLSAAFSDVGESMLNWIAENDWDYKSNGPAKLGMMSWASPAFYEVLEGFERYVEAHPEQFEWEGKFLEQAGTFIWDVPAAELKNADYVFIPAAGIIPGVKAYSGAGGEGTLLTTEIHIAFLGMLQDAGLVEDYDETLCFIACRWWNEDAELVNLAKQLLVDYHGQSELEAQMERGGVYMSSLHQIDGVFEAIKQTVEAVGAENFSNQTLHDTLTGFTVNPGEAYKSWGWTETDRFGHDYFRVYEYDADQNDMVSADPDWHPYLQ